MKHNSFVIVGLAIALIAGCSSDDLLAPSSYPTDNVVHITANVNDIQTRTAYTTGTLDEFGISIQNVKNNKYCYGNNKVKKSADVWTPVNQMLWENANQEVKIYAYAPYNSSFTGNIYEASEFPVSVSSDQTPVDDKSDFLLFKSSGFKPDEDLQNGNIPILFNHALCQLKINVTFGDEFNTSDWLATNPITKVSVNGTKLNAVCDFATQNITVSAVASASSVSAREASFTAPVGNTRAKAVYSCILIPQTIAGNDFSVEIRIATEDGSKIYTWTSTNAVKLEQGMSQQIGLTVRKKGISVDNITVQDWNNGGTIPGGTFEIIDKF